MKRFISLLQIAVLGVILGGAVVSVNAINRIDGIVWDPYRNPVGDVYVELQNELYSTLSRIRTTSSGRFSFIVAKQGNYIIRVLASGTNYLDASEPVELVDLTQFGSTAVNVDVYLKFDKRKMNMGLTGVTEAVFVQEIPDEARKLYKDGAKEIGNNKPAGFDKIEAALKIFPSYFDALNILGREYVQRKEYEKSLPYLIKSIDVNQRSYSSFYALAYACYQLNHRPEGLEAARAATVLQPNSANAQLLYGTLLRLDGSNEKAEKTLLQANTLSKDFPIPEVHWQLALLYNKLGRNKESADQLDVYLKLLPDANNKKEIKELIAKLRKEPGK